MLKQNDNVTWPTIFRIIAIISTISTAVWWASSVDSKLDYISSNLDDVMPLVQEHETGIALLKQAVGIE